MGSYNIRARASVERAPKDLAMSQIFWVVQKVIQSSLFDLLLPLSSSASTIIYANTPINAVLHCHTGIAK